MKMRSWLVAVCLPSALLAQREPLRQPNTVPVELASALASAGGLGIATEPLILVGELPEWIANRIHVPDGAVVLGSAYAGNNALAVVQMLQLEGDSIPGLEAELAKKGWRRPQTTMSGGFRYVDGPAVGMRFPQTLCSDNRTLSVSRGTARQGKQTWYFRLQEARAGYSTCNPPADYPRQQRDIPTLFHPVGADRELSSRFECSAANPWGTGPGGGTGDRVRTAISADSLLGHYGRQLADSGWQQMPELLGSVTRMWTRADSAGKRQLIRLTINTASDNPSCRNISLTIHVREP